MIVINANHDAKQAACQCLSNPAGVSITVVSTACSECKSCKEWNYFLQLGKKIKLCAIAFEHPKGWATVTQASHETSKDDVTVCNKEMELKTARQGKKKIYESRRELVLTRFCLSQRKQWRALSASGCCFYMSVAHKGLGKAWENVICAVYHRHSYFPSDSSENYKFNIIAL